MNLRPAISVPLPWLIILFGKVFGKGTTGKKPLRRLLKLPRSLTVTREGKWFIGILLFIGIAAINTGNNLLYLVVATLLSIIIVSGFMSESTLRGVKTEASFPKQIFKGSPATARVRIRNTKRFLPSFSFIVAGPRMEGLDTEKAYILKLKPGEEAVRTLGFTFNKRGIYRVEELRVSTRFPFGLFLKGKTEPVDRDVIVFPSVDMKARPPVINAHTARGEAAPFGKGEGTQLFGLREYAFGDDSRFIHWKSAGKALRLLVKEFEMERENKAIVVFENRGHNGSEPFEKAVDGAASAAADLIEKGFSVGLKTILEELDPAPGREQLSRILSVLALVTPVSEGSPELKVIVL